MKNLFVFSLLTLPALSHAGVLATSCADLQQSQTQRIAKIQAKLKTCAETLPEGNLGMTCGMYRQSLAKIQSNLGIETIFSNRFSNTVSESVEYNCATHTLRSHVTTFAGSQVLDTFGTAKVKWDRVRSLSIETQQASYSIQLAAGTAVGVVPANLEKIAEKDLVSSAFRMASNGLVAIVLQPSSVARYQSIIAKNYGAKIGAVADHFSGFADDESFVTVNGVRSDLSTRQAALNLDVLYPLDHTLNNENVSDPEIVFGQQRDYREYLNSLSQL